MCKTNIMKNRIIVPLIVVLILLFGCSSNKELINDSRRTIINAAVWTPEFIQNDTSSGIKLEFVPKKIKKGSGRLFSIVPDRPHSLDGLNITLWQYPLDTVVQKHTNYDHLTSMPENEIVDYTSIYYEFRNKPIEFCSPVEPGKTLFYVVSPGTYLIRVSPIDYQTVFIKDVVVKPNYWSVVKIDTIPNVIFVY